MAVLIVVGIGAVIWALFNIESPSGGGSGGDSNVAELTDKLSLGLPAGCEIAGMEIDGKRLAVRTESSSRTADCGQIYIYDLTSGELISTVER
jgi:hypothetical protein